MSLAPTVVTLTAYRKAAKSNKTTKKIGVSALFSPEIISKTTPEKLIRIPKICLEVVFVFQNNAPTIIVKIGIIEFIIPAMLLLTLVSAIGKRNIGIKLPAKAAKKSHFSCFFGNFFLF